MFYFGFNADLHLLSMSLGRVFPIPSERIENRTIWMVNIFENSLHLFCLPSMLFFKMITEALESIQHLWKTGFTLCLFSSTWRWQVLHSNPFSQGVLLYATGVKWHKYECSLESCKNALLQGRNSLITLKQQQHKLRWEGDRDKWLLHIWPVTYFSPTFVTIALHTGLTIQYSWISYERTPFTDVLW